MLVDPSSQASGQGGFLPSLLYVQCCTDSGCGEHYKQSVEEIQIQTRRASSKTTVS